MDTLRSPIPQGSKGGPAGTGRPPRPLSTGTGVPAALDGLLAGGSSAGAAGRRFADEVERAEERAELDGGAARYAERAAERRTARRESFGAAERTAAEPRAERTVRAPEHTAHAGPASPSTAPAATPSPAASPRAAAAPTPTASPAPTAGGPAPEIGALPAARPTGAAPLVPATPTALPGADPGALAPAGPKAAAPAVAPTALPAAGSAPRAAVPERPAPTPTPAPTPAEVEEAAEILRQVKLAASGGLRRLTVELAPQALGRVQVRVSLRGGGVDAVVEADEPRAFAALERHAPELRALIAEATGGREVTLTLLGGGADGGARHAHREAAGPRPAAPEPAGETAPEPGVPSTRPAPAHAGGVDTFA